MEVSENNGLPAESNSCESNKNCGFKLSVVFIKLSGNLHLRFEFFPISNCCLSITFAEINSTLQQMKTLSNQ